MFLHRTLLIAIVACCLKGHSLGAQVQTKTKATTPARVALVAVDSLSAGQRVQVVRRLHVKPQDVILLTPQAAALDLAAAIHVLNGLRFQHGDALTTGLEASPGNYVPSPNWTSSPYEAWITSQLTRLRNARTFRVQGVGDHRAVWITLPAPKGRLEATLPTVKK